MAKYAQEIRQTKTVLLSDIGLPNILGATEDRISAINYKVNLLEYSFDEDTYGSREYFATPREMLDRGTGDCEDYAILKMHLLLALGMDPNDLYLVAGLYNHSDGTVGGHAVLVIRFYGNLWVLDNMRNMIIPLEEYRQFEPMAAMNWNGFQLLGALAD